MVPENNVPWAYTLNQKKSNNIVTGGMPWTLTELLKIRLFYESHIISRDGPILVTVSAISALFSGIGISASSISACRRIGNNVVSVAVSCGYNTCFAVSACDGLCHLTKVMDRVETPFGFQPIV